MGITENGSATSRELARRYFVIAGLELPGFNPGTNPSASKEFFSMDARVISAFTRVFDALLPAHDDSRGWRPQPRGHFGQTKPRGKSATATLRVPPRHEGGERGERGKHRETRSRSRERGVVQSQGCGFSLFSSCSGLLSAARRADQRSAGGAHFCF
jgi:hypothetical protein